MARKRNQEQLSAQITVEDKASKQLERITKNMQKQNNELLRLKASMEKVRSQSKKKSEFNYSTKKAVREVGILERSLSGLQRAAQRTQRAFGGLRNLIPSSTSIAFGAIGAGYAGKQIFDNTFLKAAEFEMSQKTIEAMFNDKQKSNLYMKEMEKMAITSPLLNSQDIFGNSKSFIALSKEQEQLTQMWDLAERLLAVDPKQGVEGAVFALRELFSGDSRSMAERFELPKKFLNDIKNLPLEEQLGKLDKFFNDMGMTKKLVNEMGDTTLGVWNQIKESTEVGLRQIGEPAVKIIKPLLDDLNKAMQDGKQNRFIQFGQDMFSGIAEGFVAGTRGIASWIDGIINDPAFQKLDSVSDKFNFVLGEVKGSFDGWYEKEGKKGIEKFVNDITLGLLNIVEENISKITEIGLKIGGSVAKGIVEGLASNPIASGIVGAILGGSVAGPWGALFGGLGGTAGSSGYLMKTDPKVKDLFKDLEINSISPDFPAPLPKKAFGIQRVPRDNFPALLHEGETVLTKSQSNQANNSGAQVLITGNNFNVRDDNDIHKIVNLLVREMEKNLVSYGGAQ